MTAIEIDTLSKKFGNINAVDGISFSVPRGSTTALLGGNGAGKTTTIAMLLGILTPTSGAISILGVDMRKNRYGALSRMNFSSPYVDLPKRLSVFENLNVYAGLYGLPHAKEKIARLAEELDITQFLKRPFGRLSAGQQTRVSLAKALLNDPDVLLLDEPTASLDPDTADRMRGYLESHCKHRNMTILLASHNMGEVERLCDNVLMMKQGKIVDQGAPQDLIRRYGRKDMEEVFLEIARRPDTAGVMA